MTISEIKQSIESVNIQLHQKVDNDCNIFKELVSEISLNAVNINTGQGLALFLESRDRFYAEIERMREDYNFLLCDKYRESTKVA
jgi:hypothetical protein